MLQSNRPLVIGITGSIGSGKSTFCQFLEQRYRVYYADEFVHYILDENEVKDTLITRWGRGILTNNKIDRPKIAEIVFNDKDELDYLNSIIHPKVLKMFQDKVNEYKGNIIFFEVPLLFEAGLENCFDHIVLIIARKRIKDIRLKAKSDSSSADYIKRSKVQLDDKFKALHSDSIIINNGDLKALQHKADEFILRLGNLTYQDVDFFCNN